jgi:hypothetical protein
MPATALLPPSLVQAILLLRTLLRLKSSAARQRMIRSLSPQETRHIVRFVYNIIRGSVPTSRCLQRKLERNYSNLIQKLVSKSRCKSLRAKNRLLCQSGGFLPALAPLIAAIAPFIPHIATGVGIASGLAGTAGGIANVVSAARRK